MFIKFFEGFAYDNSGSVGEIKCWIIILSFYPNDVFYLNNDKLTSDRKRYFFLMICQPEEDLRCRQRWMALPLRRCSGFNQIIYGIRDLMAEIA